MLYTKFGKDWPSSSGKEDVKLTDDGRRTIHNDGLHPLVLGHLSDSNDLKLWYAEILFSCDWSWCNGKKKMLVIQT